MKITREQLKAIIKEEIENTLAEEIPATDSSGKK